MKDLYTYLLEEKILDNKDIYLWNYVQLEKWDEQQILKKLEDTLIDFGMKCTFVMVDVAKNKNYREEHDYPVKLRDAAIKASKEYKSFDKKNDKEKEKWILNKIEEIKKNAEYLTKDNGRFKHLVKNTNKVPLIVPPTKIDLTTIGLNDFNIHVKSDIHNQMSERVIKWKSDNVKELSKEIFDSFPNDDEFKEHFKGFAIYTKNQLINKFDSIYITFMFDDEFENTLEKDIKKFSDKMYDMYTSGKYMGD